MTLRSRLGIGVVEIDRECDGPLNDVSYPVWWRGISTPPPAAWTYVFEALTGEDSADEWALAAAVFIAQTRRRTSQGPTFSELFLHLLPDTGGVPAAFPPEVDAAEGRRIVHGFRRHVAIEWRRRGMVAWDKNITRSLRVGREFRARSRERQRSRSGWGRPNSDSGR